MKKLNLTQNINGADAPGRGLSSAPWNIFSNTSFNSKEVQNAENVQSGRSMIEMLGVLAIIGVLSVGGIAGYSKAMQKYRINKTIEQITLIAGNIRAFFGKNGDVPLKTYYAGNLLYAQAYPIIQKAKLVPDEMMKFDNDGNLSGMENVWGRNAYIVGLNNGGFSIGYVVSPEVCIELVSIDWNNVSSDYVGFATGAMGSSANLPCTEGEYQTGPTSFAGLRACSGGTRYGIPPSLDTAIKACYGSSNVNVDFIFKL